MRFVIDVGIYLMGFLAEKNNAFFNYHEGEESGIAICFL